MKKSGFTAIEAIIAIFVLTVAVIGAYSSFSRIAISTSVLSSRLIASYLAKEGIEIVRNIRDTNWLERINDPAIIWNDGLTDGDPQPDDYQADYDDTTLFPYNPDDFLMIEALPSGFYGYNRGTQTKFQRKITIDDSTADVLKVTVNVDWQEKGESYNFSAEEYLYNWY